MSVQVGYRLMGEEEEEKEDEGVHTQLHNLAQELNLLKNFLQLKFGKEFSKFLQNHEKPQRTHVVADSDPPIKRRKAEGELNILCVERSEMEELSYTIHPPTEIKVEEPPPPEQKSLRKFTKKWCMNSEIKQLKPHPRKKKKSSTDEKTPPPPINTFSAVEQWTAAVFSPAPTIAVKSAPTIIEEEDGGVAYPLFHFEEEEEEEGGTSKGPLTFEEVEEVELVGGPLRKEDKCVSCKVCQKRVQRSLIHQHLSSFHYKTVYKTLMCVDCERRGVADDTGRGVMSSHCRMHFRRRQLGFPS